MPRPSSLRKVNSAPAYSPAAVEPSAPRSDMGMWLFLGCLVIAASLFFRGFGIPNGDGRNTPNPDDNKGHVEPGKYDLSKTYLVRVYETADMPDWLVRNVRDDRFWKDFLAERLGGTDKLLTFDPVQDSENREAASYIAAASKRGIRPPFWLHATDSGDFIQCGPISESEGVDAIKSKILGVGK